MTVDALHAHLTTCATTVARAWVLTRRDGLVQGFTDHDLDLEFEGVTFLADAGMTGQALHQTSGLSVDNTEASGALSDTRITEADLNAGLYDFAEVVTWLVNWQDVSARKIIFKGNLGEVRHGGGAFHAELRGLTEQLNQPQGRVYQKPCSAVVGDRSCKFDFDTAGYAITLPVEVIEDRQVLRFANLTGFDNGWFERGALTVLTGAGKSIQSWIKHDQLTATERRVELWEPIRADIQPGDEVQLFAGCDKRTETCRLKFDNLVNFQGFPFIPGDDWQMSFPSQGGVNDGGSLS